MHYLALLLIAAAVLYGYFLLVGFLFTEVGPELFYVTTFLCSVGVQIGYARALFRTFATSRVWYRRLAFASACGLLALTTIDLLYIGAGVGMVLALDAYSVWWIWDFIAPVVHAQAGGPWFSFTVKSAFIVPLVLLARGFASTAIKDSKQPAFRSYFYGPAWRDIAATVRELGSILKEGFSWITAVALASVNGWHGLLTWPLVIIVGLATLAALAVAGVQLLLTLAMHSVFLVAFWLLAQACAIVILAVEKAVIRVRSRHAKCPHATCHAPVPLPVFRCPECNEGHDRLIPGRCGVLARTCKCGKGRLPTLFWLGKGRLASECPKCRKPLREELFGADVHIPIYGGPSAGKTMYMMAVTWEAVSNRKSAPDVEARLIDKSQQYDRYWKPEFEKGAVREKTAAPFPDAFLLSMQRGQGVPAVLYVYDPAGEALLDTEKIEGHNFLEYSDGLAILIDPLSLSSFAKRYKDELGKDVPPTTSRDPTSAVTRIVNQLQRLNWGKKPVALVLTKADVECFEEEFGVGIGASEMGADWRGIGANGSAALASWFKDNEPHLLNLLETHFSDVRFFAVSALGHDPEARKGFSPRRVMEPIAWLLSRRAKFANPLRERFIGPLKELGAAAAVIGLLVLLPGFAFLKWGVPYVAEAWEYALAAESAPDLVDMADLASAPGVLEMVPEGVLAPGGTFNGSLDASDEVFQDGSYFDVWAVDGPAERSVVIDMESDDLDAYLRVVRDDGTVIATNDDGGSGFNARVEFRANAGRYLVLAGAYAAEETGSYQISRGGGDLSAAGTAEEALELGQEAWRSVQAGLVEEGFSPGATDGVPGSATREALRRWQRSQGLPETGYLDGAQVAALEAVGAAELAREEAASRVAAARAQEEADRMAAVRAREDSVARTRAREDSIAQAREEAARVAAAQAREDSIARVREEAARVAAAQAREDSIARVREEAARVAAAQAREDSIARNCGVCPEMVVLPRGSYRMGSPPGEAGRADHEGPMHTVRISYPLAVGKYEVTFDEWDACVAAGGCEDHSGNGGWGRGSRPVANVSWEDARAYVRWLSREAGEVYRLLSEAEWEYAARAGTTMARHWGEGESGQCGYANGTMAPCLGDRHLVVAPVGSFRPNGWGLYDMLGNVWEWTEDCQHDGGYDGAPSDGSAWLSGGDCSLRVLRGGSSGDLPWALRSASRIAQDSGVRRLNYGFRVARTLN